MKPKNEPVPADATAQPARNLAAPLKGILGALTPAPQLKDHQQLRESEEVGTSLARIGSKLAGANEQEEGLIGRSNDTPQQQVKGAEGLKDAPQLARKSEDVRDGTPESELERAEKTELSDLAGTEIAALEPGEVFKALNTSEFDRPALRDGEDDPLAKVIAVIAGDDAALARAFTGPSPLDTIVRLLIESGARTSMKDGNGKSALDYAFEGKHMNVVRTLKSFGA